jgi:hypothetical protein
MSLEEEDRIPAPWHCSPPALRGELRSSLHRWPDESLLHSGIIDYSQSLFKIYKNK